MTEPRIVCVVVTRDAAPQTADVRLHADAGRVLAGFDCRYESLRAARPADFSKAPAGGAVWFERLGWNITGETWRLEIERVTKRLVQDGLLP